MHHARRIGARRAVLALAALLALAGVPRLEAQSSAAFRTRQLHARALGFADAFLADIHDVNSMYWNPASLVYLQYTSVVANHGLDRTSMIMNESVTSPLFMSKGEVVALGVTMNHLGYLADGPIPSIKAIQYGYDVAYSREVVPSFCLGALVSVRHGTTSDAAVWAVSSTLAAFYAPTEKISYGIAVSGLGNGMSYRYDGVTTRLSSDHLPRSLQVGMTMRFPSPAKQNILTLSIANEKVFERDGLGYKGGVEYGVFKFLAFRAGYIVDPDYKAATYGFGLKLGRVQFDYGMLPSRVTNRLYQFTLSVDIWNRGGSIRTGR
jgi:hypothetical protein